MHTFLTPLNNFILSFTFIIKNDNFCDKNIKEVSYIPFFKISYFDTL